MAGIPWRRNKRLGEEKMMGADHREQLADFGDDFPEVAAEVVRQGQVVDWAGEATRGVRQGQVVDWLAVEQARAAAEGAALAAELARGETVQRAEESARRDVPLPIADSDWGVPVSDERWLQIQDTAQYAAAKEYAMDAARPGRILRWDELSTAEQVRLGQVITDGAPRVETDSENRARLEFFQAGDLATNLVVSLGMDPARAESWVAEHPEAAREPARVPVSAADWPELQGAIDAYGELEAARARTPAVGEGAPGVVSWESLSAAEQGAVVDRLRMPEEMRQRAIDHQGEPGVTDDPARLQARVDALTAATARAARSAEDMRLPEDAPYARAVNAPVAVAADGVGVAAERESWTRRQGMTGTQDADRVAAWMQIHEDREQRGFDPRDAATVANSYVNHYPTGGDAVNHYAVDAARTDSVQPDAYQSYDDPDYGPAPVAPTVSQGPAVSV